MEVRYRVINQLNNRILAQGPSYSNIMRQFALLRGAGMEVVFQTFTPGADRQVYQF